MSNAIFNIVNNIDAVVDNDVTNNDVDNIIDFALCENINKRLDVLNNDCIKMVRHCHGKFLFLLTFIYICRVYIEIKINLFFFNF